MAVKIRLRRMGAKKAPYYRIVVADSRSPRDGRFIEEVGTYDPRTKQVTLNDESIEKWIANGAQPTDTVRALIKKGATAGIKQAAEKPDYEELVRVRTEKVQKDAAAAAEKAAKEAAAAAEAAAAEAEEAADEAAAEE